MVLTFLQCRLPGSVLPGLHPALGALVTWEDFLLWDCSLLGARCRMGSSGWVSSSGERDPSSGSPSALLPSSLSEAFVWVNNPAEHGVGLPQVTLPVCDRAGLEFRPAKPCAALRARRMLRRTHRLLSGPCLTLVWLWFQTSGPRVPPPHLLVV